MDLVESPLFTPPIILLQTVIEEVRHRSLPLYNRLKALTRMDDKKIWIFYNEYRSWAVHPYSTTTFWSKEENYRETAIVREEGETPNDRNDRGTVLKISLCCLFPNNFLRYTQGHCMVQFPFEIKSISRPRPELSKDSNYRSHDGRCCQQAESRKVGDNIHVRSVFSFIWVFCFRSSCSS